MDATLPISVDSEALTALHATAHSYLSTLLAVAECLGTACPPVGGPYQHRLSRLEKRLAFDSSKEAVEESSRQVAKELKDYSEKASEYLRCHGVELRRAIGSLEEIVRALAQRQDFYAARLRQLAAQMEIPAPAEMEEAAAAQALALKTCVEGMTHETQSMVTRMRKELASVEERLAETEITDPVTGLTNRREMERRIDSANAGGQAPVLIRFDLGRPLPDEVARQVGARIGSQFRHNDVVCRWSEHEFLVLFAGAAEIAQSRAAQVAPWVEGRYLLDTGEVANLRAEASLIGVEELAAPPESVA